MLAVFLKSKKGSAAVLTLSVILVLAALGTIALLASVSGIQMGGKYRTWSKEYYNLDSDAENCIRKLDEKLMLAETCAQNYMKGKYYSKPSVIPELDGDPSPDMTAIQATFFSSNYWPNLPGHSMEDYLSKYSPQADALAKYEADLDTNTRDFIDKLYFFYAAGILKRAMSVTVTTSDDYKIFSTNNVNRKIDIDPDNLAKYLDFGTYPYNVWYNIDGSLDETCKPKDGDIKPTVNINDNALSGDKKVTVQLQLITPKYEPAIQTTYIPYKGNPVWANAISAQGTITFTGLNIKVCGDVFSSGRDRSGTDITNGLDPNGEEITHINNGIQVENRTGGGISNVDIFGNVYCRGNLHITGSNSSLTVHCAGEAGPPGSFTTAMKNDIYQKSSGNPDLDGLYFDQSIVGSTNAGDIVEKDTWVAQYSPLIYRDYSKWGNIYCGNLSVEEKDTSGSAITAGRIEANGNVVTMDDIQMDGESSHIILNKNYLGLNSLTTSGNPNLNSSVINNKPLTSDITFRGDIIVPGIAYIDFDSPNDFQTAESITAKSEGANDILEAYDVENPKNTDKPATVFKRGDDKYALVDIDPSNWQDKCETFLKALMGAGGVNTNIIFDGATLNGYTLGASLMHRGAAGTATAYYSDTVVKDGGVDVNGVFASPGFANNKLNYNGFANTIKAIFNAKTQMFGLYNEPQLNRFSKFVDQSFILDTGLRNKILGDGVTILTDTVNTNIFNVPADGYRGIVYSKGDLEITGTGEINGAVICEGNIVVSGDVSIVYNEMKISNMLMYDSVRKFFKPGEPVNVGKQLYALSQSSTSASRAITRRYRIDKWVEGQK